VNKSEIASELNHYKTSEEGSLAKSPMTFDKPETTLTI
jgi:hypothetical protein